MPWNLITQPSLADATPIHSLTTRGVTIATNEYEDTPPHAVVDVSQCWVQRFELLADGGSELTFQAGDGAQVTIVMPLDESAMLNMMAVHLHDAPDSFR